MKRVTLLALCLCALLLAACTTARATIDVPTARLAHYRVVDANGHAIAQVEDILVAADSGQISYALVILPRRPFRYGKAAFLEASVPRVAVPWEYFSIDSAAAQLQLRVDRSTLYAAPFLAGKPDDLQSGWDAAIRAYWQAHPVPGAQK